MNSKLPFCCLQLSSCQSASIENKWMKKNKQMSSCYTTSNRNIVQSFERKQINVVYLWGRFQDTLFQWYRPGWPPPWRLAGPRSETGTWSLASHLNGVQHPTLTFNSKNSSQNATYHLPQPADCCRLRVSPRIAQRRPDRTCRTPRGGRLRNSARSLCSIWSRRGRAF